MAVPRRALGVSARSESVRVGVLAGDGIVARAGDAVLFVDASDPAHAVVGSALIEGLPPGVAAGDAIGAIERIVAGRTSIPPFALAAPAEGALVVLVSDGAGAAWHDQDGHHEFTGSGIGARRQLHVTGPVAVGPAGVEPGDAPSYLDLRGGAVPGGGAVVVVPRVEPPDVRAVVDEETAEVAAVQPAPPPLASEVAPPASLRLIDLSQGGSEGRTALPVASPPSEAGESSAESHPDPGAAAATATSVVGTSEAGDAVIVDGIRCVRGHFNHPDARFCAVCGISFQQQTINRVQGPRPPLGVVVVDDGSAFSLDSDYVIGREPELDAEVAAERARPLVIADEQRSISRVHADLRLEGWDVMLSDRGSANGTFVYPPSATAWSQLPAGQPVTLAPGTRVAVGQRTFVYESHHVRL